MASGSVASWEVVWRETDRGTESSSGSLTGISYTIDQLESTTIYTVTVRASNVAGTTDSQPIIFSTGECVMCIYLYTCKFYYCCLFPTAASDVCEAESVSSECDNTAGIIGGVVAVALITALTVIVVVLMLKSRRQPTTK